MHLPLAGSLEEGDLKVGANEDGSCYAKEVEHLNVDDTDEIAICETASLVLETVHNQIINRGRRCNDVEAVKSSRCVGSTQKLCNGEIV